MSYSHLNNDVAEGEGSSAPPVGAAQPLSTPSQAPDFFQQKNQFLVEQRDQVGFEGIDNINLDTDLWFKMRGHSLNPMIDASTPLFGLVLRMRDLNDHQQVEQLYNRVRNDIASLEEEIRQHDYDRATQIAFHYCLCTFVDEAVMSTAWGLNSMWTQRSILSAYHQETWGGEKFFIILNRMLQEPGEYQDMLEYFYMMLSLGFRGKYGMSNNGYEQLNDIIRRLHQTLREMKGEGQAELLPDTGNVRNSQYRIGQQVPLWSIWLTLSGVLVASYMWYYRQVSHAAKTAIEQLVSILQ